MGLGVHLQWEISNEAVWLCTGDATFSQRPRYLQHHHWQKIQQYRVTPPARLCPSLPKLLHNEHPFWIPAKPVICTMIVCHRDLRRTKFPSKTMWLSSKRRFCTLVLSQGVVVVPWYLESPENISWCKPCKASSQALFACLSLPRFDVGGVYVAHLASLPGMSPAWTRNRQPNPSRSKSPISIECLLLDTRKPFMHTIAFCFTSTVIISPRVSISQCNGSISVLQSLILQQFTNLSGTLSLASEDPK